MSAVIVGGRERAPCAGRVCRAGSVGAPCAAARHLAGISGAKVGAGSGIGPARRGASRSVEAGAISGAVPVAARAESERGDA
ncbi:hypothetical protein DLJ49_17545 [Rhodovulum sp. 12E13]|nr:hypothetical protein DLJ49_17545 [Rhodovulum sp. 12E13]